MGKEPATVDPLLRAGDTAHENLSLVGGEHTHGGVPIRGAQLIPEVLIPGDGVQELHIQAHSLAVRIGAHKGAEIPVHGDDPGGALLSIAAAGQQGRRHQHTQKK